MVCTSVEWLWLTLYISTYLGRRNRNWKPMLINSITSSANLRKKEQTKVGFLAVSFVRTQAFLHVLHIQVIHCLQKMDCYSDEGFWFNAEKEDYREVKNVVITSVSIVAVIKILLTDPTNKLTPQLTDGSTDKKVCF